MVPHKHVIKIGRAVRHVSRLRGGSGSALPGLVVEKLAPDFAAHVLGSLPRGVVVISGTNGKTTTTKMAVKLLSDHGLKVFTNRTGSNFTRGIIASLIAETDSNGVLDADIAVLELDEAYAAHFVKKIRPRYSLLLNVMRDQLDRFGEIDYTAKLLQTVASATTDGVVLNRDDPLVARIADQLPGSTRVQTFGLSRTLLAQFPSDQALYDTEAPKTRPSQPQSGDVTLETLDGMAAVFSFGTKRESKISLKIDGIYNVQNAAAALTLAHLVLGEDTAPKSLLASLTTARPAFGRGEAVDFKGHPLEIVLVKNPAGFRLALHTYAERPAKTMIAINDNYADGRDMSWLWDVDFSKLGHVACVSGTRAYDMALRLQYDDVEVGDVVPSLSASLTALLSGGAEPRRIFCTYTAMMSLRKLLAKQFSLEDIDA